mmetsp:Transcript_15333/g.32959  ORF Transcript_15333/g.32959 Transcript_15333/m.32959 type:complete len:354 (+) Transcript_15333:384-1445(+)
MLDGGEIETKLPGRKADAILIEPRDGLGSVHVGIEILVEFFFLVAELVVLVFHVLPPRMKIVRAILGIRLFSLLDLGTVPGDALRQTFPFGFFGRQFVLHYVMLVSDEAVPLFMYPFYESLFRSGLVGCILRGFFGEMFLFDVIVPIPLVTIIDEQLHPLLHLPHGSKLHPRMRSKRPCPRMPRSLLPIIIRPRILVHPIHIRQHPMTVIRQTRQPGNERRHLLRRFEVRIQFEHGLIQIVHVEFDSVRVVESLVEVPYVRGHGREGEHEGILQFGQRTRRFGPDVPEPAREALLAPVRQCLVVRIAQWDEEIGPQWRMDFVVVSGVGAADVFVDAFVEGDVRAGEEAESCVG